MPCRPAFCFRQRSIVARTIGLRVKERPRQLQTSFSSEVDACQGPLEHGGHVNVEGSEGIHSLKSKARPGWIHRLRQQLVDGFGQGL